MRTFVCDDCGHKFVALDIELAATVCSAPQRCTKCGSMHTRPTCLLGLNRLVYEKIWEDMDNRPQRNVSENRPHIRCWNVFGKITDNYFAV